MKLKKLLEVLQDKEELLIWKGENLHFLGTKDMYILKGDEKIYSVYSEYNRTCNFTYLNINLVDE